MSCNEFWTYLGCLHSLGLRACSGTWSAYQGSPIKREKPESPSPSSHQMLILPQLVVGLNTHPPTLYARVFVWLESLQILCIVAIALSSSALLCLGNTVSLKSSTTCGFYQLYAPSSTNIPETWDEISHRKEKLESKTTYKSTTL